MFEHDVSKLKLATFLLLAYHYLYKMDVKQSQIFMFNADLESNQKPSVNIPIDMSEF